MTEASRLDAALEGFVDLDELDVSRAFCEHIKGVTANMCLDLRGCYLDYGPCSLVTDTLVDKMSKLDGKKSLTIETVVDLGSAESMALLLTRNAKHLTGPKSERHEVLESVFDYCQKHEIVFFVDVYSVSQDAHGFTYSKTNRYILSDRSTEGERK